MSKFTSITQFRVEDCIHCGFKFGLPTSVVNRWQEDHRTFYCPSCRGNMHWPQETDEEKLRSENKRLQTSLQAERDRADAHREDAQKERRSHTATKGHHTRTKKRIANGACPCCKRNFVNLGKHMKTQHPDYAAPEGE